MSDPRLLLGHEFVASSGYPAICCWRERWAESACCAPRYSHYAQPKNAQPTPCSVCGRPTGGCCTVPGKPVSILDWPGELARLVERAEKAEAECIALRAQLAAAQADTERLDWLQAQGDEPEADNTYALPVVSRTGRWYLYHNNDDMDVAAETLRGVIDAARAASRKEPADG